MEAIQLAFKVLKSTKHFSTLTTGALKERIHLKAKEYQVESEELEKETLAIILERIKVIR